MERTKAASVIFSLIYESHTGHHVDRFFVEKLNYWRDLIPGGLALCLPGLSPDEICTETFPSGHIVPPYDPRKTTWFNNKNLINPASGKVVSPQKGRFYPKGYAWKALNCFRENKSPFRLIGSNESELLADTNHPLSHLDLTIQAKVVAIRNKVEEHGGHINHLSELIAANGPGMQLPHPHFSTEFSSNYLFRRIETNDTQFYQHPRMVHHLDNKARGNLQSLHEKLLDPEMKILDLMSSHCSHLSDNFSKSCVTGLGMNIDELKANPLLSEHRVHNLNDSPALPFADKQFDAVICTASIEYLDQPLEVIKEVARTLQPGGIFVVTVSDRWFPGKEITVWADLHPFERMGLILQLFDQSNSFQSLHTETTRGYPRPFDDPHFLKTEFSDPLFSVWGKAT